MTEGITADQASLEALVETGLLPLQSLHPCGLETTRQLANICHIRRGSMVLDVASGTGETACFLAQTYGALTQRPRNLQLVRGRLDGLPGCTRDLRFHDQFLDEQPLSTTQ